MIRRAAYTMKRLKVWVEVLLPHSTRSSLPLTTLSFICASVSSSDSTSDLSLHSPEWWWTRTGSWGLYFHVPSGTNQYKWGLDLWHFPCNRLFWAAAWKLHHEGGWMWDLGVPWVRKAAQSNSSHCKKGAQQLRFHLGKWIVSLHFLRAAEKVALGETFWHTKPHLVSKGSAGAGAMHGIREWCDLFS